MDYLDISYEEKQETWWNCVNDEFDHGERENKAIDNSKEVAHKNAILILEDEFIFKKYQKFELIVFDMGLEEVQLTKVSKSDDNYKKHIKLTFQIENKEKAITYIHYKLLGIRASGMLKTVFNKMLTKERKEYISILNKFLLDILNK